MLIIENVKSLSEFKPISEQIGLEYGSKMSYKERVEKRYNFIQEQLKLNPKYEGWDYIEYCEYSRSETEALKEMTHSNTALISSRGNLIKFKTGTNKFTLTRGSLSGKYLRSTFRDKDNNTVKAYVHRIVACTFIPVLNNENETHLCNLVANHEVNGNKFNNNFNNIKWMTQKNNIHHAIKDGHFYFTNVNDIKPLLGKYIIPGSWEGTEFVISGKREIYKLGLNSDSLHSAARGVIKTAYGCEWSHITEEEGSNINSEIPIELLLMMLRDKPKANVTTKPVLGTIIREGKYKGNQFVVYGRNRLKELGFDQGHVSKVCNGKASLKSHAGCKWEYVEQDEAEKHQRDPSDEQLKFLFNR